MTYMDSNPIAEVRKNRELLLDKYGGIDGLHKHMDEDRKRLENQGWKFIRRRSAGAEACPTGFCRMIR